MGRCCADQLARSFPALQICGAFNAPPWRRPYRQHRFDRSQAGLAECVCLPCQQVGAARTEPCAARGIAAAWHQSQRSYCRRHAHTVSARSLSGPRSRRIAGSCECGRDRLLPADPARRDRHSGGYGAAHARNVMAMSSRASAVFLDKDGTLIEDVPYNVAPEKMRLAPGAEEALHLLARRGYRLIVVSNQPGVALGLFPEYALRAVEQRLQELLLPAALSLPGFCYWPHSPRAKVSAYRLHCNCRKPAPGMLTRAARDHALQLSRSWLVGDILDDIEAGRRANCKTVLINNGNETEWELTAERCPHAVATDLLEAARIILRVDSEMAAHTVSASV